MCYHLVRRPNINTFKMIFSISDFQRTQFPRPNEGKGTSIFSKEYFSELQSPEVCTFSEENYKVPAPYPKCFFYFFISHCASPVVQNMNITWTYRLQRLFIALLTQCSECSPLDDKEHFYKTSKPFLFQFLYSLNYFNAKSSLNIQN